jgi:hypothetical protein
MERTIRCLLRMWLALLAGLLLSQTVAPRLSYALMAVVACSSPVVAVLLLWLATLRLRDAHRRIQVLRRAAKWKRPKVEQLPEPEA